MRDLIVIGGGVTGCAVARDAALRGLDVMLVEQGELGAGTSGRFHGMLQSGARYVATDPAYAAQCMREREILERTAAHLRVDTGGLFVQLPDDPPAFAERFPEACARAGIPCRPLTAAEVAAREPALAPVVRGFAVPDAVFKPWAMVPALAEDAAAHGADVRTGVRATGIRDDGRACEVELAARDGGRGERHAARAVVIAAGPWSGRLAALAGHDVPLALAKGAMLVIEGALVDAVVNRCRPPQSFDIIVPFGVVSVFGTTTRAVDDPAASGVDRDEHAELLAGARALVPGLDAAHPVSAYAGVRPLAVTEPGRDGAVSRRHVVVAGDGAAVWTVVGGSFTSHRAMAEDVVDRVCTRLGSAAECVTDTRRLPAPDGRFAWSRDAGLRPDVFRETTAHGAVARP